MDVYSKIKILVFYIKSSLIVCRQGIRGYVIGRFYCIIKIFDILKLGYVVYVLEKGRMNL